VVTAAALLMAITFTALTSAQVSFMRMFGLGVTLAVLVDATLVRMVLMPGVHACARPGQLVGAETPRPAVPADRHQRIRRAIRAFFARNPHHRHRGRIARCSERRKVWCGGLFKTKSINLHRGHHR
jgi:MMPL family